MAVVASSTANHVPTHKRIVDRRLQWHWRAVDKRFDTRYAAFAVVHHVEALVALPAGYRHRILDEMLTDFSGRDGERRFAFFDAAKPHDVVERPHDERAAEQHDDEAVNREQPQQVAVAAKLDHVFVRL